MQTCKFLVDFPVARNLAGKTHPVRGRRSRAPVAGRTPCCCRIAGVSCPAGNTLAVAAFNDKRLTAWRFAIMTSSINRREVIMLGGSAAALLAVAGLPFPAFAQSGGMKIGIVGSGRVGGTLGELWVKAGHQVLLSSRHPEELKPLAEKLGPRARAGTVQEAVNFGDVILVA